MKKKPILIGKLRLNKESVSLLSNEEMNFIRGGATEAGICTVTVDPGCESWVDVCDTAECETVNCGPNTTSYPQTYSRNRDCWHLKETVWWCDPLMSCYCSVGDCGTT